MIIVPPEGYEIDKENSTFECTKFKPIIKKWRNNTQAKITGYYVIDNNICSFAGSNVECNYNVFATKKQAKSALAMARISQIMANDERFGGVVTDEEWNNPVIEKYVLYPTGTCLLDDGRVRLYIYRPHYIRWETSCTH